MDPTPPTIAPPKLAAKAMGATPPKKNGPAIAPVKAPPAGPANPSLLEMMKASAKAPPNPKK